jgi:hypothetical protein
MGKIGIGKNWYFRDRFFYAGKFWKKIPGASNGQKKRN